MKNKLPYFFLILSALIALLAILALLFFQPKKTNTKSIVEKETSHLETSPKKPLGIPKVDHSKETEIAVLLPENIDSSPKALLSAINQALLKNDIDQIAHLFAKGSESAHALEKLKIFSVNPDSHFSIREVGEVQLNKVYRWKLKSTSKNGTDHSLEFDLKKIDGKWRVESVKTPSDSSARLDALQTADMFVKAVLEQQFEKTLSMISGQRISDAKLAGLCILFEESAYALREKKALRAIVTRENLVSYLVNIVSADTAAPAQFGVNLEKTEASEEWKVTEVNLDQLLAEYAERFSDGDIYYSPLVKNPEGGDTLALYFQFDEDTMNPRTQRQLEIVSRLLKNDATKMISISGHADALGTDQYNSQLSASRAISVKNFLVKNGVPATQISTSAKGASQPRRPNLTETGEDNPLGRRANRRTEIYLDF